MGGSNGNSRGNGIGTYTSGRVKAFWADLSDATGNTVFCGGVNGGIWKCTDFLSAADSVHWVPLADYLSNLLYNKRLLFFFNEINAWLGVFLK